MTHGVSIAKAVRIAHRAKGARTGPVGIDKEGKLQATIPLDVSEVGLKPGRSQDMLAVLYEAGSLDEDATPVPVATDDGRHAIAIPLTIQLRQDQKIACVRVGIRLPGHENADVDILVVPVRRNRLPLVAAAIVVLAVAAVLALNPWGDPSARKGHYEGKTTEEIQADLDADVAWHSMEISSSSKYSVAVTASSMTVPSLTCRRASGCPPPRATARMPSAALARGPSCAWCAQGPRPLPRFPRRPTCRSPRRRCDAIRHQSAS